MSPAEKMKPYSFLISDDLDAGLKALKERDGVPESETIRRALRKYLEERDALAPPVKLKGKKR